MIRVIFKHELHKKVYEQEFKNSFTTVINKVLEPIKNDIIKYNGSVEIVETKDGNYFINAVCDSKKTEIAMQELIDNITR